MTIPTDDFPPIGGASLVNAELAKGERLVWTGQPIPWRFSVSSLPFVLFGIPFTAFAFFWIAVAGAFRFPGAPGPFGLFALFGIPFVIVGLGLLMSPFWMYLKARRTAYAITDRRALVIEPDLWGRIIVRSFEPARLAVLFRTQHADGSGNLIFQREYRLGGRRAWFVDIGFFAIPEVREAEERVRELMKAGDPSDGRG